MTHPTHSSDDRIRLTGLSARGHHGVLPIEREEGQLFSVDLVLDLGDRGTAVAAQTDSLNEAVDYSVIATRVVAVIEGEPVNLIETLAERVADVALEHPRVRSVRVTVHKPQAPLSVAFDDVAVSILRTSDSDWDEALASAPRQAVAPAPAPPAEDTVGRSDQVGGAGEAAVPDAPAPDASAPAPTAAPDDPPAAAAAGAPAPEPTQVEGAELARAVMSTPVSGAEAGLAAAGAAFAAADVAEPAGPEAEEGAPASAADPAEPADGASADPAETADREPADGASADRAGASVYRDDAPEEEAAGDEVARAVMSTPVSGGAGGLAAAAAAFAAADAADTDDETAAPDAHELASDDSAGGDLARAVMLTPVSGADGGLASAGAAFAAADVADASVAPQEQVAPSSADATAAADSFEATEFSDASDAGYGEPALAQSAAAADAADALAGDLDARREGRPAEVVIALGGNVGGVVPALRQAVTTLRETDGVEVTSVAPLARTQAVTEQGAQPQPDFLNTVVLARTSLSPREVLDLCHRLEDAAGRVRTEHWGPRTLDADLVDYEGVTSEAAELTLPHPQASQRAFVLVPWSQADPFAELAGQPVAALAEDAPDRDGVRWLALDWIDSDHLPALPTGQYVAPPAGAAPAPTDGDEDQVL